MIIRIPYWLLGGTIYTVGHKKRANLFFCNFLKNQPILMQFSLLDFKMNDTCEGMNLTHLA